MSTYCTFRKKYFLVRLGIESSLGKLSPKLEGANLPMNMAAQFTDHIVADVSYIGMHEHALLQSAIDARSFLRRKNSYLFFAEKIKVS